ncbi:hypothetical protein AL387_gp058 [Carp edema virus]|nr:hypothetical protein AL387_gp058 [Carp edema virus]
MTTETKTDFFNRNSYRDFCIERKINNINCNYNDFKALVKFFETPFKAEGFRKYEIKFVFDGERENVIVQYADANSLISKISQKMLKLGQTEIKLKSTSFTKLHWYYLYDFIMFSTLYNRFELDKKITSHEYYTLEALIFYFIKTIYDPFYNKICKEVLELLKTISLDREDDIVVILKNIHKIAKMEINMWSSYIYTVLYTINSKINPRIMGCFSEKIAGEITAMINIKEISVTSLLYYFYINSRNLDVLAKSDIFYLIFPEQTSELDSIFKKAGERLEMHKARDNIYDQFRASDMYSYFGYTNIVAKSIESVQLLYYLYVMLRYMNDGVNFNYDYITDVKKIEQFFKQYKYFGGYDFQIKNTNSMYLCNEWVIKVKQYLSVNFPTYEKFMELPTHNLIVNSDNEKIKFGELKQVTVKLNHSIPSVFDTEVAKLECPKIDLLTFMDTTMLDLYTIDNKTEDFLETSLTAKNLSPIGLLGNRIDANQNTVGPVTDIKLTNPIPTEVNTTTALVEPTTTTNLNQLDPTASPLDTLDLEKTTLVQAPTTVPTTVQPVPTTTTTTVSDPVVQTPVVSTPVPTTTTPTTPVPVVETTSTVPVVQPVPVVETTTTPVSDPVTTTTPDPTTVQPTPTNS